ncbi:hypothetical protein CF15_06115 [Pyrodictium occultum]|uniref:Uncharacterized protein n=1 Tax=Pyrodictium occultum TaxID=2309 RepID=A0A0V8RW89_PYROC|nr:hypothetical protein [Pyrodictium occultum]KSW12316.1 hypothetical protein CF15_06115 [Pyrodictium occultum]
MTGRSRAKTGDYIDERMLSAADRAAEVLVEHMDEWKDPIDAYWLLRRLEHEVGVPVTYDIVEQAVEKARRIIESARHPAAQHARAQA